MQEKTPQITKIIDMTNTSQPKKSTGKAIWGGIKDFFRFLFSIKTLKAVGNGISWFLRGVFRVLGITYKVGMWVFGIMTALFGYGVYSSVMAVIGMEGLIVFPLAWGVIKLAFFIAVAYGWFSFWMVSRPYQKVKDIKEKSDIAFTVGKAATEMGVNAYSKFKEKNKVKTPK